MTHTYQGEEWTTTELEAICGIPAKHIGKRISRYHWTVERAISEPVKGEMGVPLKIHWQGREWTLQELSASCGVSVPLLYKRLVTNKWPVEKSICAKDFRK